jgi:hypothetical protein
MSVASLSAGTLFRPRGQGLLTIAGVTKPVGSVDLSRSITVTDVDVPTNEFYNKVIIDSAIDEMNCELTLGFRQVSLFALMIANLSDYHAQPQVAAQGVTVEFDLTGQQLPITVPLGKRKTKDHIVEDDDGVEFVEGVHIITHPGDKSPGYVSFVAIPDGAALTGTIVFDAEAAKAFRFNIGERSSIEAKFEWLQASKPDGSQSDIYHCYHKVQWRPDSDWTLSSDSADPMILTAKGKCVADLTKPVGQQLGYVEIDDPS